MYEPLTCDGCDAIVFYPDEATIGFWIYGDGRPNDRNRFVPFADEDITNEHGTSVPEGSSIYCVECAPKPVMILV